MKQKIKGFILRQNEKGRFLWVPGLYHWARNFHEFPIRSLSNLLSYVCLIKFGKHRRLDLHRSIKNGIFYVCVAGEGDEKQVVKIPHFCTKYSRAFYRKLRKKAAFHDYCNTLSSIPCDPLWAAHFPRVSAIRRDGGYTSSYVPGHNLIQIQDAVRHASLLPTGVEPSEVIAAIDQLLDRLQTFMVQKGTLYGDWPLHNLIYDARRRVIVNVDLEGLYTYQHPHFEANLEYIQSRSSYLKTILEMRQRQNPEDLSILKAISAVAYATELDVSYSGKTYPMGYHSLTLRGKYFRGQRECSQRLADVPYDFNGKTVLDLGCNCGGMLHCIADEIASGVGVDSERKCVNAANLIKSLNGPVNISFFTFDLDNEPLSLIDNFILDGHVDICFLLSVCVWLKNWRAVIRYAGKISDTLLFEANGDEEQQREQVAMIEACFKSVRLINAKSLDDPGMKARSLYFCEAPQR